MTDQVMKGRAKTADRDALLARITPTADYADLKDCDLVVEAVFEDPKVKAEVIAKVEAVDPARLRSSRSNTSTLPISGLAEDLEAPGPSSSASTSSRRSSSMMLVEIIMGKETGDAALADGARLRARDQEDADRRQRLARLLRQSLRRRLHPRRAPDARPRACRRR